MLGAFMIYCIVWSLVKYFLIKKSRLVIFSPSNVIVLEKLCKFIKIINMIVLSKLNMWYITVNFKIHSCVHVLYILKSLILIFWINVFYSFL